MDDVAPADDEAVLARAAIRRAWLVALRSWGYLALCGGALWWGHAAPSSTEGGVLHNMRLFIVLALVAGIATAYVDLRVLLGGYAVLRGIEAGDGERHEARVGPGSRRQVLELLDDPGVEVVLRLDERWLAPGRDVVVRGRLRKGRVVALVLPFGVRWRRIASVQQPVIGTSGTPDVVSPGTGPVAIGHGRRRA